jgi:hypothetical protein
MMELANQLGIKSGNLNKQHGWSVDPAECVLETSVWDQGSRTQKVMRSLQVEKFNSEE